MQHRLVTDRQTDGHTTTAYTALAQRSAVIKRTRTWCKRVTRWQRCVHWLMETKHDQLLKEQPKNLTTKSSWNYFLTDIAVLSCWLRTRSLVRFNCEIEKLQKTKQDATAGISASPYRAPNSVGLVSKGNWRIYFRSSNQQADSCVWPVRYDPPVKCNCRMTNYGLLRWLVETPSRDVEHYHMFTASRSPGMTS